MLVLHCQWLCRDETCIWGAVSGYASYVLSLYVCENRDGWLVAWGFVWVHADSFLHCVASHVHSFVTTIFYDSIVLRHRPVRAAYQRVRSWTRPCMS